MIYLYDFFLSQEDYFPLPKHPIYMKRDLSAEELLKKKSKNKKNQVAASSTGQLG